MVMNKIYGLARDPATRTDEGSPGLELPAYKDVAVPAIAGRDGRMPASASHASHSVREKDYATAPASKRSAPVRHIGLAKPEVGSMRLTFPRGSEGTRKGIANGPVGELVD
jgi:hypothetical protein